MLFSTVCFHGVSFADSWVPWGEACFLVTLDHRFPGAAWSLAALGDWGKVQSLGLRSPQARDVGGDTVSRGFSVTLWRCSSAVPLVCVWMVALQDLLSHLVWVA